MDWLLPIPDPDPRPALRRHAEQAFPRVVSLAEVGPELDTVVEVLWFAMRVGEHLVEQTMIGRARGLFADQHARDRGLGRQAGETDAELTERVVGQPVTITVPTMKAGLDAIMAAAGLGPVTLIEAHYHALALDVTPLDFSRLAHVAPYLVIVLPVGATEVQREAARAFLITAKAAGIGAIVEFAE